MNYRQEFANYTKDQYVEARCNAITFINTGTANLRIGTFTLTPDAQLSLSGLSGEVDVTRYQLVFATTGNPSLTVIRKVYV